MDGERGALKNDLQKLAIEHQFPTHVLQVDLRRCKSFVVQRVEVERGGPDAFVTGIGAVSNPAIGVRSKLIARGSIIKGDPVEREICSGARSWNCEEASQGRAQVVARTLPTYLLSPPTRMPGVTSASLK